MESHHCVTDAPSLYGANYNTQELHYPVHLSKLQDRMIIFPHVLIHVLFTKLIKCLGLFPSL